MWRRGALSLRRSTAGSLAVGQQWLLGPSLGNVESCRLFRAFANGRSYAADIFARHPLRPLGAAARQDAQPDDKPDAATQEKDMQYLRALAKDRRLTALLDDDTVLQNLRIPSIALRRVLKDPNNHGPSGLSAVKDLLYTNPAKPFVPPQGPGSAGAVNGSPTTTTRTAGETSRRPVAPYSPPPRQQQQQQQTSGSSKRVWQRPLEADAAAGAGAGAGAAPPQPPLTAALTEDPSTSSSAGGSPRSSIRDLLNQQRILLPNYAPGSYRTKCPKCNGGSSGEISFATTIQEDSKSAVWNCFRSTCGFSGSSHVEKPSAMVNSSGFFVSATARKRKEEPPVRPNAKLEPLTPEMVEFFAARGISERTLKRNGVASEMVYDPQEKKESRVIAFPYYRDGVLVNVKYRTMDKRFWQVRGAEKVLYGLDDITGQAEIIIVEGEMDKLALEEAGMKNVVSVPDGAPARVKDGALPPASEDTKYSYLWNCRAWLDQAVRVVIATDNDAPGDALAEELARRLGRERCWRVRWPLTKQDHEYASRSGNMSLPQIGEDLSSTLTAPFETAPSTSSSSSILSGDIISSSSSSSNENGSAVKESENGAGSSSENENSASAVSSSVDPRWYRKDANEVLLRDGDALLRAFVEAAEPLPIRGLLRFHEYYDDIMKLYYLELRDGQGVSTGWPSLDKCYKVVPGELTIVTGVPNSGKSEWIDALLCNLSEMHGWTFAMCSMEKRATDHARQLAEKYVGHPFFDLPYARGARRMTHDELDAAMDWVDDRFHLIRYEDEQLPSVDWVLEIAKAAVYRYGIRGLVIDPYNELDHQRPASMSETEYVSQMLTKVKRFAQTAGVHVWFVAHPRQLREWKGQAPNLYDISGSAHFINKADNGIVVHRNRDPDDNMATQVQILVRKVRNKAAGTIGDCVLDYERVNGRYLDMEEGPILAPKTSQRVQWKAERKQERSGMVGAAQQQGMFVHRDGTINSTPEDFYA